VEAHSKPGLFRVWYADLQKGAAPSSQKGGFLPHLTLGAGLVVVFVSSFYASKLADALAIIVAYGPSAYFHQGLHIANWKRGILSNGESLSILGRLVQVPSMLFLWIAAIHAADFVSMVLQQYLSTSNRWMSLPIRLLGGVALLYFAYSLYQQGHWGLHPVPLSALLGGIYLLWKACTVPFAPIRDKFHAP